MTAKKKEDASTESGLKSYNQLQAQLDAVIETLESGDISIDEVLTAYEKGLKLVAELKQALTVAENRVVELKATYGVEG